jgi:hypothetical protein
VTDIPTLADVKAENLLRAAWQLGDMDHEWLAVFILDVLPQHDPDEAKRALRTIADLLNNANAANQDGLTAASDLYLGDAITTALKTSSDERVMATYPRLKAAR